MMRIAVVSPSGTEVPKTLAAAVLCSAAVLATAGVPCAAGDSPPKTREGGKPEFEDIYRDYKPDLSGAVDGNLVQIPTSETVKLSTEKSFFSRNQIVESERAYALIAAARAKEEKGEYREALEIYQQVIDRYPQAMYRISEHGTFVPANLYCQLRILRFPARDLQFYREKHDARAAEAFEQARRKFSLEGMVVVRDSMLCTSYGPKALAMLGDAALDSGEYLRALEYYTTVRDHFPDEIARSRELALKIALCRKALGDSASPPTCDAASGDGLRPEDLATFEKLVQSAPAGKGGFISQRASPFCLTADDYGAMPPTLDPLGLTEPVWRKDLEGSATAAFVFVQPVVTDKSVIYRHQNIVYCRSLLNGELRWQFDTGGRRRWQNPGALQYPQDDVVVYNGKVFAAVSKRGPTLVAMDEITGRMAWSFGPMQARSEDEAKMSLGCVPAVGEGCVYAGYVLDDIRGVTHVDTEYGLVAIECDTGRIRWRTALCRLPTGRFTTGSWAGRRRIRSFSSPPLYHEGTVYYCTNAGAVAAVDALSGRVNWITRYPYYTTIHDATQGWNTVVRNMLGYGDWSGGEMFSPYQQPTLWYNQRPLLVGEDLYVTPVDSMALFKLDRRTGKVHWTRRRRELVYGTDWRVGTSAYFLGPIPSGELLEVHSFRAAPVRGGVMRPGGIFLVDPKTGKDVCALEDPVEVHTKHPTVKLGFGYGINHPIRMQTLDANNQTYQVAARPFISSDGKLIVTQFAYWPWPIFSWASNLAVFDLKERKLTHRRHYWAGGLLEECARCIRGSQLYIEDIEKVAHKTPAMIKELETLKMIWSTTSTRCGRPCRPGVRRTSCWRPRSWHSWTDATARRPG
ncbi:MAG: PQQ-binding-like beta-propeller repeat protein [Planctomycetota bacterium]|nr:PQQ-binding-like beta-propeller repeat protein [Planctomycetota bacterium]